MKQKLSTNRPYLWVPTLYFAEALPYMTVMTLSVIMYTRLGLSNTDLALYTGWLYLPWVIKPLWSPLVDSLKTKRWWILAMQLLVGASLGAVALTLHTPWWLTGSLAFFWLMAFSSATHDIAADGFYILALNERQQAFYVGIRSTFYRIGMIVCQGLLVVLAGWLETKMNIPLAWSITMLALAAVMVGVAGWHFVAVPKVEGGNQAGQAPGAVLLEPKQTKSPDAKASGTEGLNAKSSEEASATLQPAQQSDAAKKDGILRGFWLTLKAFGKKPHLASAILFMLLFRFPEAQLAKMAQPFMLRSLDEGGLSLSTIDVGLVYGTAGVVALLIGGVVGGVLVSRYGLKRMWWPMVLAISLPDIVYVFFALFQSSNIVLVYGGVVLEQLGYGFGFTAYSLFLVYFSRGERSTSVFALCTALQALGMMLPGMFAGWLADALGFSLFFVWVCICCSVTFLVSALAKPQSLAAEGGK